MDIEVCVMSVQDPNVTEAEGAEESSDEVTYAAVKAQLNPQQVERLIAVAVKVRTRANAPLDVCPVSQHL